MSDSSRASVAALSPRDGRSPAKPGAGFSAARALAFLRHESVAVPLLALVLLTAALVSPRGNFPLNDDWVYTKSVQLLLEQGNYAGHPFAAALTVAQMYWGALFCKLFGFSFTTLRVSTLVLSFAGAWAAARSALLLGLTRWLAVLCGALVFTSPLALNLSYTFMSDVPFMAFTALCGYYYLRALHTPSAATLVWGSVFGVLACLTRQFGVLMPVAYGATAVFFIYKRRYPISRSMLAAFFGVWLAGALIFLYFHLTKAPGLAMPAPEVPHSIVLRVVNTVHYTATALTYMGLFLLPLGPAAAAETLRANGRWRTGRLTVLFAMSVAILVSLWPEGLRRLPELGIGNMLYDLGVGPMTMSDAYFGLTNWMPVRLGRGWWLFTLCAVITAGLLLLKTWDCATDALRPEDTSSGDHVQSRLNVFLLLWGAAMLACPWNPWLPRIFDRYFVGAIVPFILFMAGAALRKNSAFAVRSATAGALIVYAFSLASLHDYFAWNHARWSVLAELQDQRHIPADQIDGGFEFNGMYTSDEFMKLHHTRNFYESNAGKTGYWVLDNEYVLGISGPRAGYEITLRAPWTSWLGLRQCEVRAFHRIAPPPGN